MKMEHKIITILGMHRSGTSAIARALPVLGVDLGDNLHPPGYDNPKGFWEDRGVLEINEQLLNHFHSAFDSLHLLPDYSATSDELNKIRSKAAILLNGKLLQYGGVWGFKEPRTCRLLPFWQDVFQSISCSEKYLIVIRNPLSVAASLAKRNQYPEKKSYFLWLQHVIPALCQTAGKMRVVVDFDIFMNQPLLQLQRIAHNLNLQPPDPDGELYKEYFETFLDKKLRHTQFSVTDLTADGSVPRDVIAAYTLLLALARDEMTNDSGVVVSEFNKLNDHLEASRDLFGFLDQLEKNVLQQKCSLNVFAGKIDELTGKISSLHQTIGERDRRIHGLQKTVEQKDDRIQSLNNNIKKKQLDIAELEKVKLTLEKNIKRQTQQLHSRQQELASIKNDVSDKEQMLQEVFTSKSWRITRPLRSAGALAARSRACISTKILRSAHLQKGSAREARAGARSDKAENYKCEKDFDEKFYRKAYPGVQGIELLDHYRLYGKREGKLPCAPNIVTKDELRSLDRSKKNILVVTHQANRSGAPILAYNIAKHLKEKYNVITLPLVGGDLLPSFNAVSDIVLRPFPNAHSHDMISAVLGPIIDSLSIHFAIVNSIISRSVLRELSANFIPTLCLVHEFAAYVLPKDAIRQVLLHADRAVFSAPIVYESHASCCAELKETAPCIIPQGRCTIPKNQNAEFEQYEKKLITKFVRPESLPDGTVVVLGIGTVELRKGVDLFLACATRIMQLASSLSFHFVWVGKGYSPATDLGYSAFLRDQIQRSNLDKHFTFAGELQNVEMAYELADMMFLSSRLDPLPQVVSEGMSRGLPVVCFEKATGWADIFRQHGLGESCVAPYLDTESAAKLLITLGRDRALRNELKGKVKQLVESSFDMGSYVAELESLAVDCLRERKKEREDCVLIKTESAIDPDFHLSPLQVENSRDETVKMYVRSWKSGVTLRKPFPGFHPGVYASCKRLDVKNEDPLAAFLRAGRPGGEWLSPLLQPPPDSLTQDTDIGIRAALHIHCYFVDLLPDLLARLEGQSAPCDLLVSVPSKDIAVEVELLVEQFRNGRVDIRVVPNRGRDIGPLLTEFGKNIMENYEVIGHVHTKKSLDVDDQKIISMWNSFLLENLLGRKFPMASTIMRHFAEDNELGLVFPEDPCVVGWTQNKMTADELGKQFGLDALPDKSFDFPVGTMFWARTDAIQPLFARGFTWDDYPEEPLPYDGTILHALERIVPFVVKSRGYKKLMSHVPGVTR